jgi:hypothetical protein
VTDPRELLDALAVEAEIGWVGNAAVMSTFAALRAVLAVHSLNSQDRYSCRQDGFAWPCYTVRLITEALEGRP